ncbi:hypothetical protein D1AOALGA4SA_2587 [Olavius algarvensis Delta 1 endosymbiont]|nr:hypothetical protein D1AOALGA4SA_2587 [Olavius algarvensis Delta 1 endosymbiont]
MLDKGAQRSSNDAVYRFQVSGVGCQRSEVQNSVSSYETLE